LGNCTVKKSDQCLLPRFCLGCLFSKRKHPHRDQCGSL
jgi:hypothetical protein